MEKLIYSGKRNACPVCNRNHDKDCRWREDESLVFCHTNVEAEYGAEENGYHYTGSARDTWGLWISSEYWWEKPVRPAGKREWAYWSADGNTKLVIVRRTDDGKGNKSIYQDWLVPIGEWREETGLYRLQDCQAAQTRGETVYFVEGEAAADALWSIGLPATTSIAGSANFKNFGRYKEQLDGKLLVICPDRDLKGLQYAEDVEKAFPLASWVYCQPDNPIWRYLPNSGGFDAEDWIQAGATAEDFIDAMGKKQPDLHKRKALADDYDEIMEQVGRILDESTEAGRAEFRVAQYCAQNELRKYGFTPMKLINCYYEYKERNGVLETIEVGDLVKDEELQSQLIRGLLPSGTTILFGAYGGSGKTVLTYQLAGAIATGKPIWDRPVKQGKVLIIQADEPIGSLKRKLQSLGYHGLKDEILFVTRYRQTPNWFRQVSELVKREQIKLIIIDSITAVTAGLGGDRVSSSAGDWLYAWRDLCQDEDCTAIFIHHLSKAGDFRDSSSFVDNVRETWKLIPEEGEADQGKMAKRWNLLIEKSNADLQGRYLVTRSDVKFGWQWEGIANESIRAISDSVLARLRSFGGWESLQTLDRQLGQSTQSAVEFLRRTGFLKTKTIDGVQFYADIDYIEPPEQMALNINGVQEELREADLDDLAGMINHYADENEMSLKSATEAVKLLKGLEMSDVEKRKVWMRLTPKAKELVNLGSKA